MANRVSNDQLEELLEYLAEHPSLAKGVGLGSRSKETIDRQWNDLAMKLNASGSGSSKTGERWKKYWADLKHKVKTRAARRRQDARGTGGGPSNQEDLSDVDRKVLAIIGENAVYGDSQHRVPIFNIEPEVSAQLPVQPDNMAEVVISDIMEFPEADASMASAETHTAVDAEIHHAPELRQTGTESAVSQPPRRRPRLRQYEPPRSANTTTRYTRIDPEWVMELERSRVEAENKMANAIHMIAEATNKIAEASLINAETSRINAEAYSKQLQILQSVADVVTQLSNALAARDKH